MDHNIKVGSVVGVYHFNVVKRTIASIEDGVIILDDDRMFDENFKEYCSPGRDMLAMIVSIDGVKVNGK